MPKRSARTVAIPAVGIALAFLLAAALPAAEPPPTHARRGLWVLCQGSQRVLEQPERLDVLLADARAMGVTDLFVQVYRGGRAWFASTHADATPHDLMWRQEDRDALEVLIARAHAQGLRVHAWVNVLSLAKNPEAPILKRLGTDAAMVDQHGRSVLDYPDFDLPQPDRAWYRMGTPAVWLDPATPGVGEALSATFAELLVKYPSLDGLHLDYIRYADVLPFTPGARFGVGLSFGFGGPARDRFRAETGREAPFGTSLRNANQFDDWRREKLTEVVARIAADARKARPGLEMSAAVIGDRERAYLVDFQHWARWLDLGLLDFAVPMLYTLDRERLRYGVESYAGLARTRNIWVGLGSWLFSQRPAEAVWQLRQVGRERALGSALFSWDSIADTPALRQALASEAQRASRAPAP